MPNSGPRAGSRRSSAAAATDRLVNCGLSTRRRDRPTTVRGAFLATQRHRNDFIMILQRLLIAAIACGATATSLAAEPATAKPESVKPGINDRFLAPDLDVREWVERFEVESREIYHARQIVAARLKLKPGDRIADIGTGTGIFVEPFSAAVGPTGWVYALDIAPAFIDRIGAIIDVKSLANVTPVLCGQDDLRLPPESLDAAFICDTYHHFEYPQTSLASLLRALKPGGQVIVIDFERIEGVSREWTLGHVRAGKEVFRQEFEDAGFAFVEEVEIPGFVENYFLRFRKPAH